MKIIQSFWTAGIKNIAQNNFGWVSSKYNLISWVLSANQLKKYYSKVELYTDALGAEILIDKLKLPYSKVHIVLDDLSCYHNELWAISKIKTYSLQEAPFLHVDGDVFIWDKFPETLIQAPIIAQNLEKTTSYYQLMWKGIKDNLLYIPVELESFNNTNSGYACNMGIVGGTDVTFFKTYANKAIRFVDNNKKSWDRISKSNFNIFFEQLLFYEMTKSNDKKVHFLFDEVPSDNEYIGFGDFDKVPEQRTYLHLLGGYKRDSYTYKAMEDYVITHYPEYYKNVIEIAGEAPIFKKSGYNFSKQTNKQLVKNFMDKIHKEKTNITEHYLLARDLTSMEIIANISEILAKEEETFFYKLPCNEIFKLGDQKGIRRIDKFGDSYSFLIDDIDEILLATTAKPINYNNLIKFLKTYLDEDVTNAHMEAFVLMIRERIIFFLSRKILSVMKNYHTKLPV
ncbi:DUF6734 family protein [Leptobacterium sp. I13]|uniref:DUF6734 family protein n=1 Tax=Leptobacterium meishanense TaxID=3128904 RepID=UPI0030ECC849